MVRAGHPYARANGAKGSSSSKARGKASRPQVVTIGDQELRVLHPELLDTVFDWMAERHRIHERRMAGEPAPWTDDPILQTYSFVNVFRVLDRTTQFLVHRVLEKGGSQSHVECCFRVILFRLFNRVETWERLVKALGPQLTWSDFDVEEYERVLGEAAEDGAVLYTPAYILPAPQLGFPRNYQNHLRLLKVMMESDLPKRLSNVKHMRDAFEIVRLYPGMGDFLAFQLVLDLNMTPLINYSEDEWAAPGPGSKACLRKIFGPDINNLESDAMSWLFSIQETHWKRIGYTPSLQPSRNGVSVVDIEHALCEVEKYSRVAFPQIKGARLEIKHVYKAGKGKDGAALPVTSYLPQKWKKGVKVPEAVSKATEKWRKGDSYEVSHIVAELPFGKAAVQYLVRWTGYGPEDDTWETEEELLDTAGQVVADWKDLKADIAEKIADLEVKGKRRVRHSA